MRLKQDSRGAAEQGIEGLADERGPVAYIERVDLGRDVNDLQVRREEQDRTRNAVERVAQRAVTAGEGRRRYVRIAVMTCSG